MEQLTVVSHHPESENSTFRMCFTAGNIWSAQGDTVKIFDKQTHGEVATYKTHSSSVCSIAVSKDHKWIASGGEDRQVILYDTANNTQKLFTRCYRPVRCVAFDPSGNRIAFGSDDGLLKVMCVTDSVQSNVLNSSGLPTLSVVWSADGRSLAAINGEGEIKIWKFTSDHDILGELVKLQNTSSQLARQPHMHVRFGTEYVIDAASGEEYLVTPTNLGLDVLHAKSLVKQGSITHEDLQTGARCFSFNTHYNCVAIATLQKEVFAFDISNGLLKPQLIAKSECKSQPSDLVWDMTTLAIGQMNGSIVLWKDIAKEATKKHTNNNNNSVNTNTTTNTTSTTPPPPATPTLAGGESEDLLQSVTQKWTTTTTTTTTSTAADGQAVAPSGTTSTAAAATTSEHTQQERQQPKHMNSQNILGTPEKESPSKTNNESEPKRVQSDSNGTKKFGRLKTVTAVKADKKREREIEKREREERRQAKRLKKAQQRAEKARGGDDDEEDEDDNSSALTDNKFIDGEAAQDDDAEDDVMSELEEIESVRSAFDQQHEPAPLRVPRLEDDYAEAYDDIQSKMDDDDEDDVRPDDGNVGGPAAAATTAARALHPAVQPGATPLTDGKQLLAYTTLGRIEAVQGEDDVTRISVDFVDELSSKPLKIADRLSITLGALGENAAVFSTAGKADKQSALLFKPFDRYKDTTPEWTQPMQEAEFILSVAIGATWVAVFTNNNYLRVFSLTGLELAVLSWPYHVVSVIGKGSQVGIISDNGVGLQCDVFDVMKKSAVHTALPVALTTSDSCLIWVGWSDEGQLSTCDNDGVVRILTSDWGNQWYPIYDGRMHEGIIWPTGVTEDKLYGLKCPAGSCYPPVEEWTRPARVENLRLPVLSGGPYRELYLRHQIQNSMIKKRATIYNTDVSNSDTKLDRCTMQLFIAAMQAEKKSRALDLATHFMLKSSLEAAIKRAHDEGMSTLVEKLKRLLLVNFNKKKWTSSLPTKASKEKDQVMKQRLKELNQLQQQQQQGAVPPQHLPPPPSTSTTTTMPTTTTQLKSSFAPPPSTSSKTGVDRDPEIGEGDNSDDDGGGPLPMTEDTESYNTAPPRHTFTKQKSAAPRKPTATSSSPFVTFNPHTNKAGSSGWSTDDVFGLTSNNNSSGPPSTTATRSLSQDNSTTQNKQTSQKHSSAKAAKARPPQQQDKKLNTNKAVKIGVETSNKHSNNGNTTQTSDEEVPVICAPAQKTPKTPPPPRPAAPKVVVPAKNQQIPTVSSSLGSKALKALHETTGSGSDDEDTPMICMHAKK